MTLDQMEHMLLVTISGTLEKTSGAASYTKYISCEMSKAVAFLKVTLSPVDSVADTYRALLPEGSPLEFQRILDLKLSVVFAILCPVFRWALISFIYFINKNLSSTYLRTTLLNFILQ